MMLRCPKDAATSKTVNFNPSERISMTGFVSTLASRNSFRISKEPLSTAASISKSEKQNKIERERESRKDLKKLLELFCN